MGCLEPPTTPLSTAEQKAWRGETGWNEEGRKVGGSVKQMSPELVLPHPEGEGAGRPEGTAEPSGPLDALLRRKGAPMGSLAGYDQSLEVANGWRRTVQSAL